MSQQAELFGNLTPNIPEINDILKRVREKHNIPEVLPEHEQLVESLFQERTLDEWETIRQEIEDELRKRFQPKRSTLYLTAKLFTWVIEKSRRLKAFLTGKIAKVPEKIATEFVGNLTKNTVSGLELLDEFYLSASTQLLRYIKTGQPLEIPA